MPKSFIYIICYQTTSYSNHQLAKEAYFDIEKAKQNIDKLGTIYTIEITNSQFTEWQNLNKLYVVMRNSVDKDAFNTPIAIFDNIIDAKNTYQDYEYKKKTFKINECFIRN